MTFVDIANGILNIFRPRVALDQGFIYSYIKLSYWLTKLLYNWMTNTSATNNQVTPPDHCASLYDASSVKFVIMDYFQCTSLLSLCLYTLEWKMMDFMFSCLSWMMCVVWQGVCVCVCVFACPSGSVHCLPAAGFSWNQSACCII